MADSAQSNFTNVDQYLESSLDTVEVTEHRVLQLAQQCGLPEEDAYQLGYAVREAMVNAVVHGNRYSANKQVHLTVRKVDSVLEVVIEDEGQGFDEHGQTDPLAEENLLAQSGRGLMIIRAFVDELDISKTVTGGTRVVMRKALPPPAEA
jgi:serine/threonine-protein kinase RsbW